ncbi:MAG: hypothetical protein DSY76_02290 [Bacteroidetes bacterium]|nr:MAG: hypothetical protein DSY76_02290 [Bacteroidota bacterium]
MKKVLLIINLFVYAFLAQAQTTVFSDNFESGSSNWIFTGNWGVTTASSHSTSHSISESPTGNYADNLNMITATMSSGIDLSTALSADLSFWAKYNIEAGFDYMYVDVSANGGTSWVNIDIFDGVLATWTQFTYSLGGYVGNSNVKVRFRFYSDGAVNYDGMYIDDVVVTSSSVDNAPPLVLHTPPVFYDATGFQDSVMASIIDISGIQTANLYYSVDGAAYTSVSGTNITGNIYSFIIPQQVGGAMVDYYFEATDNATSPNTEITDTFSFISGNYIAYDNGQVDFVDSVGIDKSVAVKISLASPSILNGILIRNYTDPNRPNDSMLVHVWTDANGVPGTDIITPIMVKPKATLQNTSAMTNIDLRPYAAQLTNLSGDIFIGYTVPIGGVWCTITQPGVTSRSFVKTSSGAWAAATGTSGATDYHFRAITSAYIPPPTADFSFDTTNAPIVSFTDLTSPTPTTWDWDFGDGVTDNTQNPTHTYAQYGSYTVKLVVSSSMGIDSISKTLTYTQLPPVASFGYVFNGLDVVQFVDSSTNAPTQWAWNFGNGNTSTLQNPIETFTSGGHYNVCLTAINAAGSSAAYCETIIVTVGMDDVSQNEYGNLYPNPMINKAFIKMNIVNHENLVFKVFDSQGREVNIKYQVSNDGIRLYRNGISRGIYLFEIYENSKKLKNGKLIIQ